MEVVHQQAVQLIVTHEEIQQKKLSTEAEG
jgi:hypothetical protein